MFVTSLIKQPKITILCISDCQVYAVGKPVFNRALNASFGSWMKDPQSSISNETIWMAVNEMNSLLEFTNKSVFKDNKPTKTHNLSHLFHVSFYYYNYYTKNRVLK